MTMWRPGSPMQDTRCLPKEIESCSKGRGFSVHPRRQPCESPKALPGPLEMHLAALARETGPTNKTAYRVILAQAGETGNAGRTFVACGPPGFHPQP